MLFKPSAIQSIYYHRHPLIEAIHCLTWGQTAHRKNSYRTNYAFKARTNCRHYVPSYARSHSCDWALLRGNGLAVSEFPARIDSFWGAMNHTGFHSSLSCVSTHQILTAFTSKISLPLWQPNTYSHTPSLSSLPPCSQPIALSSSFLPSSLSLCLSFYFPPGVGGAGWSVTLPTGLWLDDDL